MSPEREFTREEADALIPELTRLLPLLREARQVVFRAGEQVKRTARANGGGTPGKEYWDALSTLRRELERLNGFGVLLRDPETGLVDFPSTRDGNPVFLCWRLGEQRVGYWHGGHSGFAGRKPI